jgi:dihydrolipoamide dehydrogenase
MHDVVVLGGGPGGYATAFRAAARGLDVALIEADKLGGTCTHRGCIPSKAILYVAEVLEEVQRADRMGLKLSFDGLEGEAFATFRQDVIDRVFKGLSFLVKKRTTFHEGRGTLVRGDDGRVAVDVVGADGGTTRVEGRHVVLATGSVVRSLPGVEVDGEVVQTSDEALWFTEAPARAVVIGAGAIGMEFASMWAPMGTEVTVVEALDRVLPLEDADCSAAVEKAYLRRGIEVLTSASVTSVERTGASAQVRVEVDGTERVLEADRVLVAIGRAPNTADVGAAELGILDDRGLRGHRRVGCHHRRRVVGRRRRPADARARPRRVRGGLRPRRPHRGGAARQPGGPHPHPARHLLPPRGGVGRADRGPGPRAVR